MKIFYVIAIIKDEKIVNNQDGGLKVPLFDLYQCHVYLDAKISLVPKHQLIAPSTLLALATNIPTYKLRYKATKIHTLTALTYTVFSIFFKIA